MNHLENIFSKFMNAVLKFLFILITVGSVLYFFYNFYTISRINLFTNLGLLLFFFSSYALIILILYKLDKLNKNNTLILILLLAFIVRFLWCMLIPTKPASDFKTMYTAGLKFANGNFTIFKGKSYFARFPHLTIMVMYLGLIEKYIPMPLLFIKYVNVLLSTLNVYIIYKITLVLTSDNSKAKLAAAITAFFPASIMYTSVLCSENMAITFFLISIYIFIWAFKKNKNISFLILSGLAMSLGNFFRGVGIVVIIAYSMYLLIYVRNKKAFLSIALIWLSFMIPLYSVSSLLIKNNITKYSLWRGAEPSVTSILKGTNIKSFGMWNKKDAQIFKNNDYDYKRTEKSASMEIKKRLTKTPFLKLVKFYVLKFTAQWAVGDFGGANWAVNKLSYKNNITDSTVYFEEFAQFFYCIIVIKILLNIFNYKKIQENKQIDLLYIIFCGYGLLYLITEFQSRYSYIIFWIFILLSCV